MSNDAPLLPSLRSRDFRLIAGGQLVSLIGTQMQQVGVAWQLWQLTHSGWSLGILGFFRVIPIMVLGIAGGVVADAFDRRRMMLLTQLSMMAASLMAGKSAMSSGQRLRSACARKPARTPMVRASK